MVHKISGHLHRWIQNFLCHRTERVSINGTLSAEYPCISGVAQGSVLGPPLFLAYINDMSSSLSHVTCKKFADDAKIYQTFFAPAGCTLLSNALVELETWCSTNQLTIAAQKCSVLHIGYGNPRQPLYLLNQLLPVAENIKDLGVHVSSSLKFSVHCQEVARKSSITACLLLRALWFSPPHVLIKAFITYVRPILEYCCQIWSPYLVRDVNLIENVLRSFTRRLCYKFGLGSEVPYARRLEMFKVQTLEMRRIFLDLLFLFKMLNGNVDLSAKSFFSTIDHRHVTRGSSNNIVTKFVGRLEIDNNFFTHRVQRYWNALPIGIKQCTSVATFRTQLAKFDFDNHVFLTKITHLHD